MAIINKIPRTTADTSVEGMEVQQTHCKKIVVAAFADSSLENVIRRFRHEAIQSGWFDEVYIYTEKDLDFHFQEKHGAFIKANKRGYGYWIWKPYIVNRTLELLNDNDILLYLDIGFVINYSGEKRFRYYIELIESHDIVCFDNGKLEKDWDKGDVIDYFNVRNNEDIMNSEQIMSGIFFVRKNKSTHEIFRKWLEITSNHYNLIDDTPSISDNLEGFKENRHDQSVFSLLLKQQDRVIQLPSTEVEVDWQYRKKGYRTYVRFWGKPFLAIRDRKGHIYDQRQDSILHHLRYMWCKFRNDFHDYKQKKKKKKDNAKYYNSNIQQPRGNQENI